MYLLVAYVFYILAAIKVPKKPDDPRSTADEATKQGSRSHFVARRAEQITPAVIDANKPNDTQKQWWPQTFKEWAEVFGVFVLLVYTFTTIALWCAAKNANKQTQRNSRLDQRAWVTVSEITPSDETKSPWEISIVFKNTGRTPAKSFEVQLAGEPVAKGGRPKATEDTYPGHGIIAPDGFVHSGLSSSTPYNWETTDLVIHGKISYDSIFGHRHWTQFCYYFIPKSASRTKGGFTPCDQGNDVDDNEP